MAATRVLLDTGPLVAFLSESDGNHEWAADVWKSLYEPLYTCEAVFSEAVFLLASDGHSIEPLLEVFERGLVTVDPVMSSHLPDVCQLLRKYADRPMSLADACLVRMAELNQHSQVFTLDRDFLIYRRKGRQTIPLLAPFA